MQTPIWIQALASRALRMLHVTDGKMTLADVKAIAVLAVPLGLNSALQSAINLTDTWFVGRLSASALAAVGATYWLVMAIMFLFGGTGFAVQAFAAQAHGAGRHARASRACWTGLWIALLTTPAFIVIALAGESVGQHLGLPPDTARQATEYWAPRIYGGPGVVAFWTLSSFFAGTNRVTTVLYLSILLVISNACLNYFFVMSAGYGVAGSGWASTASIYIAVAIAMFAFVCRHDRIGCRSHLTWRPNRKSFSGVLKIGVPTGVWIAFDLLGLGAFQAMMSSASTIGGATTQIVMMLTSIAFLPAVGIGMAGTSLVGQSIGNKDVPTASRIGNTVIVMSALYMLFAGLLIAAIGWLLIPLMIDKRIEGFPEIVVLGQKLLWIAAIYQFFDGLNLGSGFCLRATGDVKFAAKTMLLAVVLVLLPLAHFFTFSAGHGWIDFGFGLGLGAVGGWLAAVAYIMTLGLTLSWRWRRQTWARVRIE